VKKITQSSLYSIFRADRGRPTRPEGKLAWREQWRDVITCLNSVKIGPLGVDRKFVRLWKALGMAKLPLNVTIEGSFPFFLEGRYFHWILTGIIYKNKSHLMGCGHVHEIWV
jgi:hypothetical protein